MHVCVCNMYMPGAHRSWKRAGEPGEFHMVLKHLMHDWNKHGSLAIALNLSNTLHSSQFY